MDGNLVAQHLDRRSRIGLEILVPAGVAGRATLGRNDHPAVPIGSVDQRRRT